MKSLGIYVHTPFCKKKCSYCDFYSKCGDKKTMVAYSKALCKHIEESNMLDTAYEVDTIYFGGGTPTVMPLREIERIVRALYENFKVLDTCEMTIEANPESVEFKYLKRLKSLGFNRISMGVQSTNDDELEILGRIHNFEQVKTAVNTIREADFDNLSLDLMYGLPEQNIESFKKSLSDVIALSPEHISCYALKLEEGTHLYSTTDVYNFPDDDAVADMYLMAVDYLAEHGYKQYEISNFAKENKFSRHNKRYWNMSEYLGFGPAAHSFINKLRFNYFPDTEKYINGVLNNDIIIEKSEEAQDGERAGEYVMLALRTTDGISAEVLEKKYLMYFDELEKKFLNYHKMGYAEFDGISWRLTPKGFLVSNTIISELLIALENSRGVVKSGSIYNKIV